MTRHYFKLPDGGFVIACTRGERRRRCIACGGGAERLCDGCDKPVCSACAVGHTSEADFCPDCARPAFLAWLHGDGAEYSGTAHTRDARRRAFRVWVRAHAEGFLALVTLSSAGAAAAQKGGGV